VICEITNRVVQQIHYVLGGLGILRKKESVNPNALNTSTKTNETIYVPNMANKRLVTDGARHETKDSIMSTLPFSCEYAFTPKYCAGVVAKAM
jgi:hypothetical protein